MLLQRLGGPISILISSSWIEIENTFSAFLTIWLELLWLGQQTVGGSNGSGWILDVSTSPFPENPSFSHYLNKCIKKLGDPQKQEKYRCTNSREVASTKSGWEQKCGTLWRWLFLLLQQWIFNPDQCCCSLILWILPCIFLHGNANAILHGNSAGSVWHRTVWRWISDLHFVYVRFHA